LLATSSAFSPPEPRLGGIDVLDALVKDIGLDKTTQESSQLLQMGQAAPSYKPAVLCAGATASTSEWLKVDGKRVYTDTAEQCMQQVLKHCPQKKYFVYKNSGNDCPSDCPALHGAGKWNPKCDNCASCGCVSGGNMNCATCAPGSTHPGCAGCDDPAIATSIQGPCPTKLFNKHHWTNNCFGWPAPREKWMGPWGMNSFNCHRNSKQNTYSIPKQCQGKRSCGKPAESPATGAVRAQGGATVKAGKPFVPEVYFPGKLPSFAKASPSGWYPICSHYFSNNNNGATLICKALKFTSGTLKQVRNKNNLVDAFPIGVCNKKDATKPDVKTLECTGNGHARGSQYSFFTDDGVHIGDVEKGPLKPLWKGCKSGKSNVIEVTCT